jgi:hypothetical protein
MNFNLICIFICTPICTKKFILVKSGCYTFSRPTGRYVINTYCALSNIASVSYCYCTCELNILGIHIEASVPTS